ncbi:hypothetical protein [Tateyamaria sp. SN6-1]|uniref:hypothetical protein n=1 Tax=Tateyamaria sp. SN6-1 TaxID=3092148 RepID=UPI0039F640F7
MIEAHFSARAERYYSFLSSGLAWTQRVYGSRWSARSFGVCLAISFFYPVLAAIIVWVMVREARVGGASVFGPFVTVTERMVRFGILFGAYLAKSLLMFGTLRFIRQMRDRLELCAGTFQPEVHKAYF